MVSCEWQAYMLGRTVLFVEVKLRFCQRQDLGQMELHTGARLPLVWPGSERAGAQYWVVVWALEAPA